MTKVKGSEQILESECRRFKSGSLRKVFINPILYNQKLTLIMLKFDGIDQHKSCANEKRQQNLI